MRYPFTAANFGIVSIIRFSLATHVSFVARPDHGVAVQKDLMRQTDIKTTMNLYGKAMPEPMREANSEVVRLVFQ